MELKYLIRVQAIALADDDGSHGTNITAGDINTRFALVNTLFAPANIEFIFNEQHDFLKLNSTLHNRSFTVLELPNVDGDKWDHDPEIDTKTHDQARNELAKQFSDRLVIFIHYREGILKADDEDLWSRVEDSGGSSGATDFYLEMSEGVEGSSLAHELGHYLQLPHTFETDLATTVSQAATAIRKYVENDGHAKEDGLDALDSDRKVLLDTPADVGSGIWKSVGLNKCGPVGRILIPVTFTDGSKKDYTLAPDRRNLMSYFKGCPGDKIFSPQQIRRMRDALELRLRHNLISIKPSFSHRILRGGTGEGGAILDVDMALVRAGRVVTVVRTSNNELKLIIWDINEAGTEITRRGDIAAGTIREFSVCSLGQNMLATAVVNAEGHLKMILWQVEENGEVKRLKSVERQSAIKNTVVSIIRYGQGANFFATVSQHLDDRVTVDVWEARADGSLIHKVDKSFDTIPQTQIPTVGIKPQLAMSNVGTDSVACQILHETMHFGTFLWSYDQGDKKIVERVRLTNNPAKIVASCSPARELSVAAIRDDNNKLKLIAFRFPADAKSMERGGEADAGEIGDVEVCTLGTEMVVTGHRRGEGSNRLKVILWQVTKSGSNIIRLTDEVADEEFSVLSMCQTSRSQFATAIRDSNGKLKVIAWRVPPVIASPLPGPSSSPHGGAQPRFRKLDLDDDCDTVDK